MKKYIIGLLLISFKFVGFAQVTAGDCSDAINICSNAGFAVDPNGFGNVDELGDGFSTGLVSNPSTNPNIVAALGTPNSGCLLSGELNSTWMLVNIASNGALEFSFGADGGSNCYDWIMWQYSPTACADITGDLLPPVACNWNGVCESFTGMAGGPNGSALPTGGEQSSFEDALNVLCGEQYLICFSNYSSAATNVPLNFFGSASIDCGVFNPITVNDTTVCEGVCVTLTAQGGNTYSWDANPDLSATTGATVDACPNGSGTFDYYVTGTGLCGTGVDTATVTVVPLGDPTITGPTNVNPSDPPFALNVGTAGGTWTSNCGACFNSTTGMFDPSIAGPGAWEVCYELGVVPCDTMDCIDIMVGCIPPDVDPIAAITECDSYILPGITGTNLTGNEAFFTGTGGTGTQYNPGDVITSSINLFIYDVLTGTTCFDEETGFNITIVNSPDAGADNSTVLCSSAATLDLNTLLSGADPGGVWAETTASGQFTAATGIFDPNGLPGNTFTFTYTVVGSAPCVDDVASFDVSLVTGPPVITCPGNLTASCDITEQPVFPDLASFIAAGGLATDPNGQLDASSFTLLSEVSDGNSCPEVVTRTYEVANACGFTATCSHTITIHDLTPPTGAIPPTVTVNCPSDVPVPNIADVINVNDNCSDNPIVAHVSDVSDGNVCNNETITRIYSITDDCGNSIQVSQSIVISAASMNVEAGNDLVVCEGDAVILTASNVNGANIDWNNNVQDGVSFIPPLGITTYVLNADFCSGLCVSSDSLTVEVVESPEVVFSADIHSGCNPLTVTFTNETSPAGSNCLWDFGDGNQTTGCGVVSNTYTTSGSFDVSLVVTNSVGCTSTETYTNYINVHPIPLAAFNLNPGIVDVNDLEVDCINNSVNATDFVWDFGDGTSGTGENPTHLFPDIPDSYYTVTLHATSEFGCVDSTQRTMQVQDVLLYYVPNAFTPDDDEFNQTFQPVFTSGFDPFDFKLLIFDRWGEVIFESRDAQHGWDGTYGGKTVQQGVYTWTIEFKETMTDKRHTVTGHVNILY